VRRSRFTLLTSSIGKKIAAAVSGSILLGFLLVHMLGNLKAFGGIQPGAPDGRGGLWEIDEYARFLRSMGAPLVPRGALLWTLRIVLISALVTHVALVVDLARRNRGTRPLGYARTNYAKASLTARTMMWSGMTVLVFLVLHLLHFTTGSLAGPTWDPSAVHAHLSHAFRKPWLAGLYLLALAALFPHVRHGAWSAVQTLGWNDPRRDARLRALATAFALLVVLGFASVPIAFLAGWVPDSTLAVPGATP